MGPRSVLDAVVKRKFSTLAGNRTLEPRSSSPYNIFYAVFSVLYSVLFVNVSCLSCTELDGHVSPIFHLFYTNTSLREYLLLN